MLMVFQGQSVKPDRGLYQTAEQREKWEPVKLGEAPSQGALNARLREEGLTNGEPS